MDGTDMGRLETVLADIRRLIAAFDRMAAENAAMIARAKRLMDDLQRREAPLAHLAGWAPHPPLPHA